MPLLAASAMNTVASSISILVNDATEKPREDGSLSGDMGKFQRRSSCPKLMISDRRASSVNGTAGTEGIPPAWEDDELNAELGLCEDYFSRPEGHFGFTTSEELEMAIENCKELILECTEKSVKKKKLVMKLVQLRMKLQELREGPTEALPAERVVMGHHFEKKQMERTQQYCEKCCNMIWGMIQGWYCCRDCGFKCHAKCLNHITRTCAQLKVVESSTYLLDICPEVGLSAQGYRCAECRRLILSKEGFAEPRRCDYNGLYYCSFCHWNSLAIVPSRVIHNWDFDPRMVCRSSLQYLKLMRQKPVLRIEKLNPHLFSLVGELTQVKHLRKEIMVMKQYFLSCQAALQGRLLLLLKCRQHFVENEDTYSLQDLVDLHDGTLIEQLSAVRAAFVNHITIECEGCRGKGFYCEVCKADEILFPFSEQTSACPQCYCIYHRECYIRRAGNCAKCERRQRLARSIDS